MGSFFAFRVGASWSVNKVNIPTIDTILPIIIKNAKRLKKLTEDILDVTKIEGNTLHLNKKEFFIGNLLQSTIKECEDCLNFHLVYPLLNERNLFFLGHLMKIQEQYI